MVCKICGGSGITYNPKHISSVHPGLIAAHYCICTIKKENKMIKDVCSGSTVAYLDDTGKYPCIKQGNVVSICGTHYLVNDQRLHHNQLLPAINCVESNKALYQAAKTRLKTLEVLVNQLGRKIADESIQ